MNVKYKLAVGISIFAMLSMFFAPFFSQKVYAAPATSKAQLESLAKSLKFKDKDTIEGKIGNNVITFKKKVDGNNTTTGLTGINVVTYEAPELACDGFNAVIRNGYLVDSSSVFLVAKYKDGGGCSDAQPIKLLQSDKLTTIQILKPIKTPLRKAITMSRTAILNYLV